MNKHVLPASLGLNKSIALSGVKPLDGSSRHDRKSFPLTPRTLCSTVKRVGKARSKRLLPPRFTIADGALADDLIVARSRPPRSDRQALAMLFSRTEIGRPLFLPPAVPADRVEALRRAFDATMKDEGFLAEAKKIGLDIDPLSGEQVQTLVDKLAATPLAVVARVQAALSQP